MNEFKGKREPSFEEKLRNFYLFIKRIYGTSLMSKKISSLEENPTVFNELALGIFQIDFDKFTAKDMVLFIKVFLLSFNPKIQIPDKFKNSSDFMGLINWVDEVVQPALGQNIEPLTLALFLINIPILSKATSEES
jgi:hypothetical protein